MSEAVRIVAGLGVMLAFVGMITSATILLSAELRRQSEAPAFLCLIGSLVYLVAFVHSVEKLEHPITTSAASSHAARPSKPATTYSFGDYINPADD